MNEHPLVACLTNSVAVNFTANVLLAIGAKPAMVEEPDEAAELAGIASALLVNVGTVHRSQAEAMRCAIASANDHKVPWVLDPVAVQSLSFRRNLVREFLLSRPTLVRGNAEEISFLQANMPEALVGIPLLATAEDDKIFNGKGGLPETISDGEPMLQQVTATGCAQGAICAAFLGRGFSPVEAAREASLLMKRAGVIASDRASAPGSFKVALVDALYEIIGGVA